METTLPQQTPTSLMLMRHFFFYLKKVGYGAIICDWKGTPLLAASMANSHIKQWKLLLS